MRQKEWMMGDDTTEFDVEIRAFTVWRMGEIVSVYRDDDARKYDYHIYVLNLYGKHYKICVKDEPFEETKHRLTFRAGHEGKGWPDVTHLAPWDKTFLVDYLRPVTREMEILDD